MKKGFILLFIYLAACQPQTETRLHMDNTGDRMSDSILRIIDSSLADPSKELASKGLYSLSMENKQ